MNKILSTLAVLLLVGCTQYKPFDSYDYHVPHPEFPTVRSSDRGYEFQIAIHRSWRDSIYVVTGKSYDDYYIGWVIDDWQEYGLDPLKYSKISQSEWTSIKSAFEKIDFFKWDVPCWEKAYEDETIYFDKDGKCIEIVQMDGGALSFLAVTPEKTKAVYYVGAEDNDEIVKFAEFVLKIAGVKKHNIPRWGYQH